MGRPIYQGYCLLTSTAASTWTSADHNSIIRYQEYTPEMKVMSENQRELLFLFSQFLESETIVFFLNLKQKVGSTSECNPKQILVHWLASKWKRNSLDADILHFHCLSWSFRMPRFDSSGNLGDKLIMEKGIKWILLCSGWKEKLKKQYCGNSGKVWKTTCAYFIETRMKNLQQSHSEVSVSVVKRSAVKLRTSVNSSQSVLECSSFYSLFPFEKGT